VTEGSATGEANELIFYRRITRRFSLFRMDNTLPKYNPKQRKVFWIVVAVLGLLANIFLPLGWVVVATLPIVLAAWWIAYQSNWF
jgi:fatty acid desaturase